MDYDVTLWTHLEDDFSDLTYWKIEDVENQGQAIVEALKQDKLLREQLSRYSIHGKVICHEVESIQERHSLCQNGDMW